MANVAFYTVLSPEEVLGSAAVAVTYAERAFGIFAWTVPGELKRECEKQAESELSLKIVLSYLQFSLLCLPSVP